MKKRKIVFICSPLRGDFDNNRDIAESLCRIAALKGHLPIAPHVYFTRFLDEFQEVERTLGIESGLQLLELCDEIWVFNIGSVNDDGTPVLTEGMAAEVEHAKQLGKPIFHITTM